MRIVGLALMLIASVSAAADTEYLQRVQSPVVEAPGAGAADLAARARGCVLELVSNQAVVLRDQARVGALSAPGSQAGDTTAIAAGDVLTAYDPAVGLVVAQSRVPWSQFMLGNQVVESTVTIEAREGRFRITHTNIRNAFLSTGYAENDGFKPVLVKTLGKKVEPLLAGLSDRLAACIAARGSDSDSEDW